MCGNIPSVLFHGTDVGNDIVENGIRESALQRRDRGFYGDGFYVTESYENAQHHAVTVANKRDSEPEILRVELSDDVCVLNIESYLDGVNPTTIPPWHSEFIDWVERMLDDAAVWEKIPGKTRDDIVPSGIDERTPGHDLFDGDKWRRDVTRFARDEGYDIVYWNPTEIVVVDPNSNSICFQK